MFDVPSPLSHGKEPQYPLNRACVCPGTVLHVSENRKYFGFIGILHKCLSFCYHYLLFLLKLFLEYFFFSWRYNPHLGFILQPSSGL